MKCLAKEKNKATFDFFIFFYCKSDKKLTKVRYKYSKKYDFLQRGVKRCATFLPLRTSTYKQVTLVWVMSSRIALPRSNDLFMKLFFASTFAAFCQYL